MLTPVEVRHGTWVHELVLTDETSDTPLARLSGSPWSVDRVEWTGDATATLALRRYPGSRTVEAHIDAERGAVAVEGGGPMPLSEMERALDQALDASD